MSFAEEAKPKKNYFDYYNIGFDDIKNDFKHVTWDSHESSRILLWGGVTSVILGTTFKNDVVNGVQGDFERHDYLGKYSTHGDTMGQCTVNLAYAGFQFVAEKFYDQPFGYQRSALMVKASVYAGTTTLVLKNIVRQRRPNYGDSLSFPSGHTTTAFAFASVVAAEHEWYWGAGAYSLAAFVGASRMNDNAHYLHDVLAGATIGAAFGIGLSELYGTEKNRYYKPELKENSSDIQTLFLPTDDGAKIFVGGTF